VDQNKLFYGDNLQVLRQSVGDESVDLIYLDPPFNSNRSYNVIFARHDTEPDAARAQIQAFDDTWRWTPTTEHQYETYVGGLLPNQVSDALSAFRTLLGENDAMAYLVNMAPRLVELRRVLKPTGSLYLHCDPTMSHYLKVLLDTIFGADRFLAEIVWKRTSAHNRVRRFGPVHDIILAYSTSDQWVWNPQYIEYDQDYLDRDYRRIEPGTGRRYRISDVTSNRPGSTYEWKGSGPPGSRYWAYAKERMEEFEREGRLQYSSTGYPQLKRYLDEMPGQMVQDVWVDIQPINNRAAERLGYPTQKPVSLLERIILASTNPGALVLDPFCGCGTTIDAAQKLGRRWTGIDVTYLAIDLIEKRLRHTYGESIQDTYTVHGIPRDKAAALALFSHSPFDFERWAVSLINAQPNAKQVKDKGVDGVARFPLGDPNIKGGGIGKILVSVKGGKNVGPQFVRDLIGTVETQKAQMGVLITMAEPTPGVLDAVNHGGVYKHPGSGDVFPRVQTITIGELLKGKRPKLPATKLPYIQAAKGQGSSVSAPTLFES
jgi:DNA modification methylase